ncbi:hypothetical protein CYMTET_48537 [Cymbomonas tetramitiformis]|uniref:Uncharacterized protein n=1 Tax=Cymbomonas tetramitiformis TaxID=36881 RepID=A0AAE0EWP3_9CHLO|nr:hypothetical protein CYMTET_48537 [Cymbomonas tetramitiformis]
MAQPAVAPRADLNAGGASRQWGTSRRTSGLGVPRIGGAANSSRSLFYDGRHGSPTLPFAVIRSAGDLANSDVPAGLRPIRGPERGTEPGTRPLHRVESSRKPSSGTSATGPGAYQGTGLFNKRGSSPTSAAPYTEQVRDKARERGVMEEIRAQDAAESAEAATLRKKVSAQNKALKEYNSMLATMAWLSCE